MEKHELKLFNLLLSIAKNNKDERLLKELKDYKEKKN